jgi:hypothetical protein
MSGLPGTPAQGAVTTPAAPGTPAQQDPLGLALVEWFAAHHVRPFSAAGVAAALPDRFEGRDRAMLARALRHGRAEIAAGAAPARSARPGGAALAFCSARTARR